MEDRIKLLPERIANQIAAGEVVHRPASVVKEMMENAIDAGATEVIVNYRRGGEDLIQIIDNGVGMTPNDARMSFERHATSKITTADDIYKLRTFGFRGEALASICAVSQVELRSRHQDAQIGTTTIINGGEFVDQQPTMCDVGSQFLVRNLFYNLPARRSFLEREVSKPKSIKDEFQRVALCNPHISFELYGDDSPIYKLAPTTLAGRIVDVIGRNIKKNLLEVSVDTVIVKVSGYIGVPKSATKGSSNQFLFVNGRYFRSPFIHRAICTSYEKLVNHQLTPAYFLFLEVDPNQIDVNIHPQKTEVKFADEESVWQIINAAVRETLAKTGVVSELDFDEDDNIEIPIMRQGVSYAEPKATSNNQYNPFDPDYIAPVDPSMFEEVDSKIDRVSEGGGGYSSHLDFEDIELPSRSTPHSASSLIDEQWSTLELEDDRDTPIQGELLGHVTNRANVIFRGGDDLSVTSGRYAWCEIDGDMSVIDLRRAKERLLYDYYLSSYHRGVASQQMLFASELRLSQSEYLLMMDHRDKFAQLGFDIEYCDNELLRVNGLPADVAIDGADQLISELIRVLDTPQNIEDELRERLALTMARSGTLNMPRQINSEQAKDIVSQIMKRGDLGHSPSGKAIVWRITKADIKRHLG